MKLKQLLEMPQFYNHEMTSDDGDMMTPFFITDERMQERCTVIARKDNVVVAIAKDLGNAMLGVTTARHDGKTGVMSYGNIIFKGQYKLGTAANSIQLQSQQVLQISVVTVIKDDKFKGLGSFMYSSLVQAGFTIISDNQHFVGGKELWKKLSRSHLANEVVYLINRGAVVLDEAGKPLEYNGTNLPDDKIWSSDEQLKYILFVYRLR